MRRYFTHTVLAAVMVVGLAAIAGAQFPAGGRGMQGQGMGQGRGMMGGPDMGSGRGGPMAALRLTPEQRKEIQSIMQKQRETNQETMQNVREQEKRLHEMIYGGAGGESAEGILATENSAVKLATEIDALKAKTRIHMQMAVAAVLTPEQRTIVLESGMEFPPAQMGRGGPGGMRGGRGGQPQVKK
jgi:Spy/CpxP family protein refolding chaperone